VGCDIHLYVEKRVNGTWEPADDWKPYLEAHAHWCSGFSDEERTEYADRLDIEWDDAFYSDRNYDLFAILANVRNGYGFAGVVTGEGFVPIAMPRGLPADATAPVKKRSDEWGEDGHSHSWLTLAELLAYDWDQTTINYGVMPLEIYKNYQATGKLTTYSGGVWGENVLTISQDDGDALLAAERGEAVLTEDQATLIAGKDIYVQARWRESYRDAAASFLNETLPKLQALGEPADVRIVFWFDN
jgi:hypothetical protein